MKRIFALIFAVVVSGAVYAQDDKSLVDASVSKAQIEADMMFIASDELKGRDTGSPEIKIASVYIATVFQAAGVQPGMPDGSYFQDVPLKRETPPSKSSLTVKGRNLNQGEEMLLMAGEDGSYEGDYVFVDYGLPGDLEKMDLEGKVVVALIGNGDDNIMNSIALSREKVNSAKKQGAVALVELYKSSSVPWTLIVNYMGGGRLTLDMDADAKSEFPLVYVNDPNGEFKTLFEGKGKDKASLTVQGKVVEKFNGRNVVGIVEGTDPVLKNEFVALTAHYDHVGINKSAAPGEDYIYNGARDNGMGTVSILSAARNLAKNPPKRSVILVAYTGEEKGLLGSQWFVQNSPVQMNQVIYNFNVDNAGYSDTSLITVIGLGRTTADPMIQESCKAYGLTAISDPAPEQNLFDRSDNVNFARMGVPAPTFSGGFKAFDEKINKFYHQVTDNPETIDYDYLHNYTRSYILAARKIANSNERPFWVEGDKYEDAGKQLYGISTDK